MATLVGSRSGLYWRTIPGGLPSIVDVTKVAGNVFFVDSTAADKGDTAGHGTHPDTPFATIDYAVGQCTANQGDHIIVLPGHVETVTAAAGLDLDVAGITIVFAGFGNARGYVHFTTAPTADMDVDAADITLINPRFVAGIDALAGPIDVNAARFRMIGGGPGGAVTWQDGTTINTTDCVVADANADDMLIEDMEFIDGDAAGTQKQSFIQIAAATRPVIRRLRATGDFGTGVIENGTAWVDALLDDCVIENTAAGPVVGILLQATSSGTARNVHVRVASGTTYITANNDMQWFECYGVGTDAAAGDHIGTVPAASIEGKIDTLQAELSGGDGIAAFPNAAAPANAVSIAEVLRSVWAGLMGTAAGENGITTWPAAAAPADAVSLAEAVRYIVESLIGTITNTGGTATIGAILGDLANVTLAAKLGAADGATTESLHGKLGTDTELADRSLYDQINGAGPAAAAAAAAPANDVSLYAAVRYIVETLVGTLANTGGTATLGGILGDPSNVSFATNLAKLGTLVNTGGTATLGAILGDLANVDLATKLGAADGATTESLHGKLGTDTELADRSLYDVLNGGGPAVAAAAAAPANDVSLYGVLRAIYDRQLGDGTSTVANSRLGKKVTRAAADIFDGTAAKSLFTVSGGRVLLTHLEVEVTVANIDAGASNMNFVTNPTVGTDMNLAAVLDINADELGTIYSISGIITDAVTGGSGGGAMGMERPIVVPEGAVAITTAADVGTGGALGKCELWYIPLDDGASVAAA